MMRNRLLSTLALAMLAACAETPAEVEPEPRKVEITLENGVTQTVNVGLLKDMCEQGLGVSCMRVGFIYLRGFLGENNFERGVEYTSKACELEQGLACASLAHMYLNGEHFTQDSVTALELYQRACDQGSGLGCSGVGAIYYDGVPGIEADLTKAREAYEKGCEFYQTSSCSILGGMFWKGQGAPQSDELAAASFEKSCLQPTRLCAPW